VNRISRAESRDVELFPTPKIDDKSRELFADIDDKSVKYLATIIYWVLLPFYCLQLMIRIRRTVDSPSIGTSHYCNFIKDLELSLNYKREIFFSPSTI